MNQLMFYLFSAIIITFSILTVTNRRILRSAVFLLFVLISTAGLYFMLNYFFLAAVQLTLYAGGIVVLIIFSILLTSHINEKFEIPAPVKYIPALMAVLVGAALSILTILSFPFKASTIQAQEVNMETIGKTLLSTQKEGYALPFEVISILLLAAMVAAIVIAKKRKG